MRSNHWALLQIIKDEANQPNVSKYDSAYDDVGVKTNFVISQLIRFEGKYIPLRIMKVSKQVGITDCGLYAIANLKCQTYKCGILSKGTSITLSGMLGE